MQNDNNQEYSINSINDESDEIDEISLETPNLEKNFTTSLGEIIFNSFKLFLAGLNIVLQAVTSFCLLVANNIESKEKTLTLLAQNSNPGKAAAAGIRELIGQVLGLLISLVKFIIVLAAPIFIIANAGVQYLNDKVHGTENTNQLSIKEFFKEIVFGPNSKDNDNSKIETLAEITELLPNIKKQIKPQIEKIKDDFKALKNSGKALAEATKKSKVGKFTEKLGKKAQTLGSHVKTLASKIEDEIRKSPSIH
jgi:hypothetical protein